MHSIVRQKLRKIYANKQQVLKSIAKTSDVSHSCSCMETG